MTTQELKNKLSKNEHCFNNKLVFVDDIDYTLFNRKHTNSLASTLLSQLDSSVTTKGLAVRIFTTNEEIKDEIEDAFLRPGRIDRIFTFDPPTRELRWELVETWHQDILSYTRKFKQMLLDRSENFSFAETQDICTNLIIQQEIEEKSFDLGKALHDTKHKKIGCSNDPIGFTEIT